MVPREPREKWTDERLDDLNKKVDETRTEMREGFARVDADIRELRGDLKHLHREMNARFDSMNDSINTRFEALNRNLIAGFFVIVAAIIGSNAF